ncbi:Helix-turn-helix, AraC domain protein [Novosphingobium nitrogenifigens DSM 19370]|uniref:Helix-turn-helix, AraC domain protein n=1 Tax=Novosphingobium nitrogenifigens DSM 19370 TaxID=983920 RepID=F1ZDE5_9SPHN|nr:AraC family transcriptional regulator ligand-binding domain-containing protein [Novosphingobium nitrogenifigens]EGD57413.1 Helix-turn-helix, AraC domain protein [Novosphingobium nitrogenifigens DSM 19370]
MVLPVAHTASLLQFERYARLTGIELDTILDADHLALLAQAHDCETMAAQAVVDIFQIVATAARRGDLGIAFAMWSSMRGYGPLSLVWEHSITVEQLLRLSGRFLHLETEAIGSLAVAEGDEIAVQQFLSVPTLMGGSQYLEATLTLQLRSIRNILGPQWHPVRAEFAHPAPDQTSFHRSVFRCPLVFGADRNALLLRRDELRRPSPSGNPHLIAYLERQLEATRRSRSDHPLGSLERFIAANLAGGGLTLARAAMGIGVGERSLQRTLARRGLTFSAMMTQARQRVATDYFTNQRKPNLGELAHRLGYAEASAASRFLRENFRAGARTLSRRNRSEPAA